MSATPPDSSSSAPRPAATLILLREGAAGPEVFLLQRSHRASFVAGAYVFPGGSIDAEDAAPRVLARVRGMSDAQASARLGIERGGLAYWIAAVRECFEEGGILLAQDERGAALDSARVPALEAWRARLNAGERSFADFLEAERLVIPAGELAYYAHWITAPGRARRFDTRFFVALAPRGQSGSHDNAETIRHAWLAPREALARSTRGEIELVFATQRTLEDLARFARREEAFAYAADLEEIETNRACWAVGPDGAQQLFRRLDAPYFEIHWSDPEETGRTRFDIVHGRPKRLDRLVTRVTAPNPGMMTGHGTNSYLVGDEELAVIDPGPAIDSHVAAIIAAANGRRIRFIVCTHTHLDHSPAAAALAAATGAEVVGRPAPAHPGQDAAFNPQRVLEHGERLRVGGVSLRAVHTPGHASNHLCYMLEETGMLFTGDHVMQGSTVIINPPDGDMRAYLDSLALLLDEDIAILAPGHGYLIGAPHKEVKRLIAHRNGREAKIGRALAQLGRATLEELVPSVYDDVPAKLHAAAARSLAAHLAKLLADGRVREQAGSYMLAA
jgi:glyoxylase-like metal-dependent hydrolase (beta-lactamase superfamily II)/8-oxo-dGTP pyrophosphatase MutT (NUDIX family)